MWAAITATIGATLGSCSKNDITPNNLPYITFGVAGVDVQTETKALITSDNITSLEQNVYVYGVKNNDNNNPLYNNIRIFKQDNSNNWKPAQNSSHINLKWEDNSRYSFHAYTASPKLETAPTGNNPGVKVEHAGIKITVAQPSTYGGQMADYMLSHSYLVDNGSNYHVVMLYMQHAMAWVEIIVKKEMPEHVITLNSLSISRLFTQAEMQCESQARAHSGNDNVWLTTLKGANDQGYTATPETGLTPEGNNILGKMSILAVPQQLYRDAALNVNYTVKEHGDITRTYDKTFYLFNYTPYVWEAGHKITYTLNINTGVDLSAEITDWNDAGYTEGVIIPNSNN